MRTSRAAPVRKALDSQDAIRPWQKGIERSRGLHHDKLPWLKGKGRCDEALEEIIWFKSEEGMDLSVHDPPPVLPRYTPATS
jgi:hypothetical protein